MLYLIFLFFLQVINAFIFYFDTENDFLKEVNPLTSKNNNSLFIFLPGTSSICDNYSDLFNTINLHINTLCLNYKSDLKSSIKYYEKYTFVDRSFFLEKSLKKAINLIFIKRNINFLNENSNLDWNRYRVGGHSQGGVLSTVWAKYYNLQRLILFNSPGCQFGKRLHNWIRKPFLTNNTKIFGVESLQDSILPWYYGNFLFSCKKNDGIYKYLQDIGILSQNIQKIDLFNFKNNLKKDTQIILFDIPLIDGTFAHLITCFNLEFSTKKININRKRIWKNIIL